MPDNGEDADEPEDSDESDCPEEDAVRVTVQFKELASFDADSGILPSWMAVSEDGSPVFLAKQSDKFVVRVLKSGEFATHALPENVKDAELWMNACPEGAALQCRRGDRDTACTCPLAAGIFNCESAFLDESRWHYMPMISTSGFWWKPRLTSGTVLEWQRDGSGAKIVHKNLANQAVLGAVHISGTEHAQRRALPHVHQGCAYFSSATAVFCWEAQMNSKQAYCIAGHPEFFGRRGGYGWHARFTSLSDPTVAGRYLFIEDEVDNKTHHIRIDLKTFQVADLTFRGVVGADAKAFCQAEHQLYVVVERKEGGYALLVGDHDAHVGCPALARDLVGMDWSALNLGMVRLTAGQERKAVAADCRLLVARCKPFAAMLSGGMREASGEPVHLGDDVLPEALTLFVAYIYTDEFSPLDPARMTDASEEEVSIMIERSLQVLMLAEKYLIDRLALLCADFLRLLVAKRPLCSLQLLARLHLVGKAHSETVRELQNEVFAKLRSNWSEIAKTQLSLLHQLIVESNPVILELLVGAQQFSPSLPGLGDEGESAAKRMRTSTD